MCKATPAGAMPDIDNCYCKFLARTLIVNLNLRLDFAPNSYPKIPLNKKNSIIDNAAPTGSVTTQERNIRPTTPKLSAPIPRATPTPSTPPTKQ